MKKEKPKPLSIILINWNNYEMTKDCILSIRKNTFYPNYEIFLVDNGSIDGSIERLGKELPFLKIIKNKKNMGFPYALNQGYRQANGYYLAHINNDAIVLENCFEEAIKVLESDKKIAVAGFREISEEQANNSEKLKIIRAEKNQEKMTLPVGWVTKKQMIGKIGYLDAEYFSPIYGEEADWNFRARNMGYKIVRASKANVVHYSSVDTKKHLGKRKYLVLINYHRLRAMLFNLSIINLLRFTPGLGLILLNSFWQGTFLQILKSYWLNLKDWRLILEQRKGKRGYIPFKEPKFTIIK